MFCTASVVVFVITGQVLIIFYKTAASSRLDIAGLLCVHQQLSAATNHLTICFTPILLTNCAHIFFCLIFYSHSFLSFVSDLTQLSQTIWDGLWIFEAFARLWLICSTADAVRKAVIIKLVNIYKTLINNQLFPSLQVGGLHQHFAIPSMFNNLHSTTI